MSDFSKILANMGELSPDSFANHKPATMDEMLAMALLKKAVSDDFEGVQAIRIILERREGRVAQMDSRVELESEGLALVEKLKELLE